MGAAVFGDNCCGGRDLAVDTADRGDQLGHGVLGGHRVVEDGGIQGRRVLLATAPVAVTTALTASKIRFGRSETASRRRQ